MATGLSISTTSNLTSSQQTMMVSAKSAFEPAAPDPSLVDQQSVPEGHYQLTTATYARLAQANALSEGVDLSQVEQLSTNILTINPSEHGILVTISTRLKRRQNDSDVVSVSGRQMGGSLRRRESNDIIALYDEFSVSAGSAGNPGDITTVRGAVAYLLTDNDASYGPAPVPLNAAMHIEQISDIILDLTDNTTGIRAESEFDDILKGWWKASDKLYSVHIFHSGNIARDGDNAKGAIFNKFALVEAEEGQAEPTEEIDNSLRVTEYGLFKSWGEGERADAHGVEYHTDAASTL